MPIVSYRAVFPGAPVYLCTFHVLQAWLKQLRVKIRAKQHFKEAFQMLRGVMYLKASGTEAERMAAVDRSLEDVKAAFSEEKELLEYFHSTWEKKKGLRLYLSHNL